MTVRRRLFWSNILMIFVPVIATMLIGLLCVGIIWVSMISGAGVDMEDPEDFNRVCLAVTESMEHRLETGKDLNVLDDLLNSSGMSARVYSGENEIYTFGSLDKNDEELAAAVGQLSGNAVVSQNGRSLYSADKNLNGKKYTICLFGGNHSERDYDGLKTALVVSAVILFFTIILAVILTNRFLTRFVFQRIEEPLDILTDGVHEIRDGNLDHRIDYPYADEFKPVCEDFNEMAARLKDSVTKQQMQEMSRKELLAGISHDIRSPLTSIQAYVEGLLDGIARTPEAQRSYLTTIKTKAQDLDHMVSQLFLFSKMELGDYPDNACRLRLDEKIEAHVSEARDEFSGNGLVLEAELEPVTVMADPVQLDRVISNIMGNSLKYNNKENGILRISLTKNEKKCHLTFDDDGPGVPEEALPHLFEVFYRSDPARKNPQKGSGLGLAIVESIVTHVGGSIAASNNELGGLRIEITLPCEDEKDSG